MFEDRLKAARENKGLSVKQAAAALRLPYTTYNNYEKNQREPTGGMICKLAEFYGVSTDYLLGRAEFIAEAKQEESAIQKKMDALDEHGRKLVELVLDAEYDRCSTETVPEIQMKLIEPKPEERRKMITVRSSEYRVSAGTGFLLDEGDCNTEVQVPDTPAARKADFALTISGNSMEPIYHDGDIVLVKRADIVRIGEIGIFIVDGNGYIKKYGGDRLISLNSAYSDIILATGVYAKCCGLVIGRV